MTNDTNETEVTIRYCTEVESSADAAERARELLNELNNLTSGITIGAKPTDDV